MKKLFLVVPVLVVVALLVVAAACAGPAGPPGPGLEPMTRTFDISIGHQDAYARPAAVEAGLPGETKISTFYRWQPPVLVVFEGDTVVLNVINDSGLRVHSLVFPAFDLDTDTIMPKKVAPAKEDRTVTLPAFVAAEVGIYRWECGVPHNPTTDPIECSAEHAYQHGWLIVLDR